MLNTLGALGRAPGALLLDLQEDAGTDVDVYLLTETWLRGDPPHLAGLQRAFSAPRQDGRGGVAGYVADSLHCRAAVWRSRPQDGVLWLHFSGVHGLPADLLVAVCYLPPALPIAAAAAWFYALADECAQAMAAGLVLLSGDFNARTREEPDVMTDDGTLPRRSMDPMLSGHGRELLSFCQATGLRMCNGRVAGDVPAQPTSRGQRGTALSVVDYFLACPQLCPLLHSLSVSPTPTTGSDHCHLRLDISLTAQAGQAPPPAPAAPTNDLPPEYTIVAHLLPQVEAFMQSQNVAAELQAITEAAGVAGNVADVQTAALDLQHVICSALEAAGMRRRRQQPGQQHRRGLHPKRSVALTQLRRRHRAAARRQAWAEVTRLSTQYRRLAQQERRQRQHGQRQRLAHLLQHDPASFFARFRTPRARACQLIPKAAWLQHFRSLLGDAPPALPMPPPSCIAPQPDDSPARASLNQPSPDMNAMLQAPFSVAEIRATISRTRNRAAVVGPLKPVVLKHTATAVAPVLTGLFNACARVGCLPACWAVSAITPVPKIDTASADCNAYRGIAVGTLPAKLYAAALDRRIADWTELAGMRAEGQFGFRRNRNCAQAALVLRATIERCRSRRQPLYAAFVDFQKAYDTVPRHLLWAKLEAAGLQGWCLRAVQALYADVPVCVRTADGCTDMFQSQLGLKQGCPLSPNLFGLYVDDLPAAVAADAAADLPRLGDGSAVPSLMYADDLTCLATSPSGLQHQMNKLDSYAAAWGLAINVQKTKMVVFHGQRRRAATPTDVAAPLTTSGAAIEAVDEFRYLGIHFHGSLAFATAATARAAAANRAMHAMRCRCAELGLQGAKLQMQMFNTMVLPVLSYGAEVWSPQLIAAGSQCAATRVQTAFLRHLLGVRQSTPSLVLLAETGQRPLMARWAAQLGRFWNTVLAADETTLVMRALRDSCALAGEAGAAALPQQPWAGQVAAALHAYGVDVDLHRPQPVTVACITNNAATLFRQQLSSAQGTRIRAYNDATGAAAADGMPGYLAALQHRAKWRALAQLRTGSHWLAEETGRWQQQPRAERLCSCCAAAGEQHVEDVEHAVLVCRRAAHLRGRYPSLFTPAHTHSVHSFLSLPEPHLLASYCRALYCLHTTLT